MLRKFTKVIAIGLGIWCAVWSQRATAEDELNVRRKQIEGLSPAEKLQLQSVRQKFLSLAPEEQSHLRSLQHDIEGDANREQLSETMERYHAWLRALPPAERESLQELPPAKRLERIQQLRAQQLGSTGTAEKSPLSSADQRVLIRWLETTAWRHREELVATLPDAKRENFKKLPEDRQRRAITGYAWLVAWAPPGSEKMISADEKKELAQSLSADAKKAWDGAVEQNNERELIRRWVRSEMQSYVARFPVAGTYAAPHFKALQQFMRSEYDAAERERLMALPSDERTQELRERWEKRFGVGIESRKTQRARGGDAKTESPNNSSDSSAK